MSGPGGVCVASPSSVCLAGDMTIVSSGISGSCNSPPSATDKADSREGELAELSMVTEAELSPISDNTLRRS